MATAKKSPKSPAKNAAKAAPVKKITVPSGALKPIKSALNKTALASRLSEQTSVEPKAVKAVAKPVTKPVAKPVAKPVKAPQKPAAAAKIKGAAKTVARVAAAAGAAAGAVAGRAAAGPDEGKRRRRSRPRVTSSGPPTAAWFSQGEKPRSSSFIPAPPRAEAPSLVAAPPASSDRLVASHELTEFAVRTAPVRVDVEAGAGRIFLSILPLEVELRVCEGIEWDFRYIGGADVIIDEIVIEFDKPSPLGGSVFRSRRPGAARPHRQLSGAVHKSAAGKRVQYTIRAMNAFKTEMAATRPWVSVIA